MAKNALRFLGDEPSPVNYTCDILDKDSSTFNYIQYMFDRTNRMFKYENLPETIPAYFLEYMLQIYGMVVFAEVNGSLYAFRPRLSGPPDPYYRSTSAIVANPALGISQTFAIVNHFPPFDRSEWDTLAPSVLALNDTQMQGLLPLFSRYATQMTENDISIRSAQINTRIMSVITADNGPEIESAKQYLKDVESGHLGLISKRGFLDGIGVHPATVGSSNIVTQLIELQQYLKASWYNEIGLNSNFNMKRQYVSSEEINSTSDIMLPLVDNMLDCRRRFVDDLNSHFGTYISVEKDSAWEKKQIQSDISVSVDEKTGESISDSIIDYEGGGEDEEEVKSDGNS